MFADEERKNMNSQERIFGYTGGAGMIQGLAAGYFLWDLVVTLQNLKVFGFGMLAHALSALTVFSFGFVRTQLLTIFPTHTDSLSALSSTTMAALSSYMSCLRPF